MLHIWKLNTMCWWNSIAPSFTISVSVWRAREARRSFLIKLFWNYWQWGNLTHSESKIFTQKYLQIFLFSFMPLIYRLTFYLKVTHGQVINFHCKYNNSIQKEVIPWKVMLCLAVSEYSMVSPVILFKLWTKKFRWKTKR